MHLNGRTHMRENLPGRDGGNSSHGGGGTDRGHGGGFVISNGEG